MQSLPLKLDIFLNYSRKIFLSLCSFPGKFPENKVFFILGNESADLDSAVGSICFAYHRQHIHGHLIDTSSTFNEETLLTSKHKLYLPVINCPKIELPSRFEWNYVSELMNIPIKDLIFFEEILPLLSKSPEIVLFDHNAPSKSQEFLIPLVKEIMDHHEDICLVPTSQLHGKIVKKSGSCCSILGEHIDESGFKLEAMEKPLLFGLFSTVLVDTMNFDEKLKGNRWIEKDREVFERIHALLCEDKAYGQLVKEIGGFYKTLIDLKFSEKQNLALSLPDIFKKDAKKFEYGYGKVAFSSINVNPFSFFSNYTEEVVCKFVQDLIKEDGLIACVLLFVYPSQKTSPEEKEESLCRDLLVFSTKPNFIEQLEQAFSAKSMKMIKKEKILNSDKAFFDKECHCLYYDEERIYSRKLLEPIIAKLSL